MKPSPWSTIGAAVLLTGVAAILPSTRGSGPREIGSPPALERSAEVVEAKIARKAERLAKGEGKRPDSPDGAEEYRHLQRTRHGGEIPPNALLDAKRQVEAMMPRGRDAGIWNWTWLGPGNVGGRIRAILVHPNTPSTMWIGAASGGIWKTTNSGGSWAPLNDFLPSLSVTQLVMDPGNPNVLYASTGEGFGGNSTFRGAGIFKSTNGGTTWTQLPASVADARYVNDLAIHPTVGQTLYASVRPGTGGGRVWKTTNGGTTWNKNVLVTPAWATDIKIDPDNPNTLFVGTGSGAWRSTDAGSTWDELTDGTAGSLPDSTGRVEFHAPAGSNYVWASVALGTGRLYRSLDNGATWTLRSTVGVLGDQGWYDNVVWCEDQFPNSVMWGGIDLWKSLDGGSSFTRMSNWELYHGGTSAHADQHVILPHPDYDPPNNLTIFFGNDGGIQRTNQGFLTTMTSGWLNLANNLGITQFYRADVSPDGSMFLGGTQDNSDLRLTTGGTNGWYQAITGDGGCCNINPSNPDLVYVTKQYLYVWGSSNGGATYSPRISGLGDGDNKNLALFVAPVEMDKNAPFVLYAGGTSVWESRDGAHSWHSFFAPRPGNPKCSAISVGPALVGPESADLWFGYEDGQLVSSANRGVTWWNRNPAGGPLPDGRFVTDIEVSPHDRNVVLVSFGGYEPDGVWLTTNGGSSWTDATGDAAPYELPSIQVNCVSFHPSHPDWIYAGTDIGLFASEDGGHTWNVTSRYGDSEGPVFTEVDDIIWHSDSRLVAVTHGRGMYECTPLDFVFVDAAASGYEDGTWNDPWNTVGEGLSAIGPGATLSVRGGAYSAGPQVVTRRITLTSNNGTAVIQ